jgi:Flp pilus assembly protein TadG
MASRLNKVIQEDRGSAILEFTIAFPLLVTLGFGAFEFSNAFHDHQAVASGIRDAARYFARLPVAAPGNNPCVDNAGAILNAQYLAVYGTITAGTYPRVPGWAAGNVAINCVQVANPIDPATGEPDYRGTNPLWIIKASTNFSYQPLGLLTVLGLAAPALKAAHYERWIGG